MWKLDFLVILQKFFHSGPTQPSGASLSIHYNGNRRRQLCWSNVMDWPLLSHYKKRPMYWSINTAEFHNKKITHCVESTLTCMLVVLTIELLKYAKYMYFYTHNPFTIIINNTIMHQRVKLLYWYTLDLSKLDGYNLAVQPLDIIASMASFMWHWNLVSLVQMWAQNMWAHCLWGLKVIYRISWLSDML